MKKFYLMMSMVLLLAACNTKKEENKAQEVANQPTIEGTYSGVLPSGIYEGKLPTASGEGMNVTVTLTGDTYKQTIVYTGKSTEPFVKEGTFTWNKEKSIITLEGMDAPNQYFVSDNTLTHLDMEGNKITGELADMYILKKK
ncbi:putative lipoprotein NlpE involved in copper resistance [Parabacteroides sp. PF5-5]|uniref:copper resistance protein NlpE n=1 Tax=unclassified Parabacteroides TaxID=2649774 RepID=UPI002475BC6E|nr:MULTISPECIES: copper resistance protein NlpE [unclassified Parabacteroides]MDH6305863.1 putative lipoprotein NlpE involved in copper resistance [Parabacteroides sp. PH5-39]MDH6317323.1 putative lipoprotein NlpE involved in copper resistance [Parabacteroides sp. PF5-13]MDH6320531.1 putative lipoprotein NlpE involved in copper resistance [Parabacteroides sp. PH5-13]MDH6324306.1 putative lipoprotein NlpE involved in copper resistance [Parabacteroides sp. PH5-8]MDH6328503.1 putative lipoprotein